MLAEMVEAMHIVHVVMINQKIIIFFIFQKQTSLTLPSTEENQMYTATGLENRMTLVISCHLILLHKLKGSSKS